MKKDYTKIWTEYAKERLVGRTITDVSYLTSEECEDGFGWYKRPITFTLDDGKEVVAQMDDEGNDGGVLLLIYPGETVEYEHSPGQKYTKTEVLPVLGLEN